MAMKKANATTIVKIPIIEFKGETAATFSEEEPGSFSASSSSTARISELWGFECRYPSPDISGEGSFHGSNGSSSEGIVGSLISHMQLSMVGVREHVSRRRHRGDH